MVLVYLACEHGAEHLSDHESLGEAIADVRSMWNEEAAGPQLFWVQDEAGRHLAVLMRPDPDADPELCLTLYPWGLVEQHYCHYELDAQGRYERTAVSEV